MTTISYVDPLVRAWERAKVMLFSPIDPGKWLIMGFAAWLAGLARGGKSTLGWDMEDHPFSHLSWGPSRLLDRLHENLLWLPLIAMLLLLAVGILILGLWLSSRGKMVFLDNVVHNHAAIGEPWRRLKRLADSLFKWRLGFTLVCLGAILTIGVLFFAPAMAADRRFGLGGVSLAAMVLAAIAAGVVAIIAAYVALFLDSFVVPIMYKFNLSATAAWRYLIPWLSTHSAAFLLYGLFVLVLFLGLALSIAVVAVMTCCVGALILALPYVGTVLLLPLITTFRLFSLEFLAQLDPGFSLLDGASTPLAGDDDLALGQQA